MAKERGMEVCSVAGCNRSHEVRNFCVGKKLHGHKQRKEMNPMEQEQSSLSHDERINKSIGEVPVHFSERDRTLFFALVGSASRNRRTLTAEILFQLDRLNDAGQILNSPAKEGNDIGH